VSALFSLLQEKIITESKSSSLIFLFQLDVVFPKWFNVFCKLTANVPPLHAVAKFGTNYFLLKIKILAKRERELATKFAIAKNGC
jgi:hypothetical protein